MLLMPVSELHYCNINSVANISELETHNSRRKFNTGVPALDGESTIALIIIKEYGGLTRNSMYYMQDIYIYI